MTLNNLVIIRITLLSETKILLSHRMNMKQALYTAAASFNSKSLCNWCLIQFLLNI